MAHNAAICHATGERRMNYLNQIKCILDRLDDTPCLEDRGGTSCEPAGSRPLIEYPGYINRLNPKFNKPFYVPLITNVQVKEIRPTSNLADHIYENNRCLEYVQAGGTYMNRAPPNELRAGYLIHGCDCVKHNGLQDQCQRLECGGRPQCLTDPPSCPPANAMAPPKPQPNLNELVEDALARNPAPKIEYCCCQPECGIPVNSMPQSYQCYPCRN
ncbi:uncharacterized protein LOC112127787 [Cimex lectularius]|uniref:Uncharacterized protein n=1 Tax=Cimex lectularius TaxID=79782 RepID=A0A8I6SNP3_CIMLE|nr:uncharacterized protein LOC112127787 [Cimex lectularius]